jgi:hypothetical protein
MLWKLSSIWNKILMTLYVTWIEFKFKLNSIRFNIELKRNKLQFMHKVLKVCSSFLSSMTIVLKKIHISINTPFHSIYSKFQTKIYFGRTKLLMNPKPIYPISASMLPASLKYIWPHISKEVYITKLKLLNYCNLEISI